ncbi:MULTISPECIES: endonuclease domain-containing protein [Methylomonas]|uniref:Very-short-patch-repair endonuclease n=1 Tax=Methylomonas methanica TaxID=421 RepID=A0ABY2CIJ7_METMH|nr:MULTISPECIES: endonuclease domain-containing protein [Methylomonas]TCV80028.1 very-short-patch-repair endonuclease [Methylomonas methanica]
MKQLARALRKNQTDAEKLLWYRLRNRQLAGCKFRRQQVIGPYIADFLCLEPKLIIELDGGQHATQQDQDEQRTRFLESLGYRVLRFWNHDVIRDIESVLETIRLVVIQFPHPGPIMPGYPARHPAGECKSVPDGFVPEGEGVML